MQAVAVLPVSLVLLALAGAPDASAQHEPTPGGPIRLVQGQLPSIDRPVVASSHDTASATRYHGHFFFDTEINGIDIHLMFDTGATWVSLRAEDAAKVGISLSSLNYTVHTTTANGIAAAAPIVLKELKVGGITRRNVPAIVAKPGALGVSVLGQSFMTLMAGFSTEGNTLTLRGE
jgi:aspartyl protease family protein